MHARAGDVLHGAIVTESLHAGIDQASVEPRGELADEPEPITCMETRSLADEGDDGTSAIAACCQPADPEPGPPDAGFDDAEQQECGAKDRQDGTNAQAPLTASRGGADHVGRPG
jgi:hypothetical protein